MIEKRLLEKLYVTEEKSMMDISHALGCSHHKVVYWMKKHEIVRRSISDAIYKKANPAGDPFTFRSPQTLEDANLFGMGMGLYWGEGTKADTHSIRLGNSDPKLIETFISFLVRFFSVKRSKLKFGLQLFTDIDQEEAMLYWTNQLSVSRDQFYKTHVTISGSIGNYRRKSKYGVVTVYFHNKKLRDIIVGMLPR